MSCKIPGEKVMEYIRNTLQPVSYDVLISKFCSSKEPTEARKAVKNQLQKILLSNVKSGSLMHYRNHFYCSSLSDDLQEMVGFDFEGNDLPSDQSDISISSCESVPQQQSPKKNVEDVEVIRSSNILGAAKSELSEIKSQTSNLSYDSLDTEEETQEGQEKK